MVWWDWLNWDREDEETGSTGAEKKDWIYTTGWVYWDRTRTNW